MIASKLIAILIVAICIIGCRTPQPNNTEWAMPAKPFSYPVHFVEKDNGLYMDETSSINLWKNIDGMDAYAEKLEALIAEMKKYYGAK